MYVYIYWDRVLQIRPQTHYRAKDDFELLILLPPPPEGWLAGMCSYHTLFLWSLVLYTLGIHCTTCTQTLPPKHKEFASHEVSPNLFYFLVYDMNCPQNWVCIICVCRTGNPREAVQPWRLRQFCFLLCVPSGEILRIRCNGYRTISWLKSHPFSCL